MPISTDAAFEQALQACAAEPIHLIGQVQPHAGEAVGATGEVTEGLLHQGHHLGI